MLLTSTIHKRMERKSSQMKRFLFYSKKTVCLLLVLILTAAFVPAVYAAEPEDALIKGTFTMTTFDGFDPTRLSRRMR